MQVQLLTQTELVRRAAEERKKYAPLAEGSPSLAGSRGESLRRASHLLEEGQFERAAEQIPAEDASFAAERLRFLAQMQVKGEAELACLPCDLSMKRGFERLCTLAGANSRVYAEIARSCAEKSVVYTRIAEGKTLLTQGKEEEAASLACKLIGKYPLCAGCYDLYAAVRCASDAQYDPVSALEKLSACPDAFLYRRQKKFCFASQLQERVEKLAKRVPTKKQRLLRAALIWAGVLAGAAVVALVWTALEGLFA